MKMAEPRNIINMGRDPDEVISFGGGWCNHYAPEKLRKKYQEISSDRDKFHETGRYSSILGNLDIREQLCRFEEDIFQLKGLSVDNIIVGQSSTQLFFDTMKVICDPGDGIGVLDPTYANYVNAVKCALPGSTLRFVPALDIETWEYMPDVDNSLEGLKELQSAHDLKALVIPNPDNPTSQLIPEPFLKGALEILEDRGAFLVMDYAYKTQYFGEMPGSFSLSPDDHPNLISLLSNSKWISSLGRRLGWVEASPEVIDGMEKVAEVSLLSPDTMHSITTNSYLIETLEDGSLKDYIESVRKLYWDTSRVMVKCLEKYVPLPYLEPQGGLYTCLKVDMDPVIFCEDILANTGVLLIPGVGFGPSMDRGVRVSYGPLCYSHDLIEEGLEAVGNYLNSV